MTYIGYGVVERWLGNFFTRTEKSIHVVLYYMFESEIKESRKSGGALFCTYAVTFSWLTVTMVCI